MAESKGENLPRAVVMVLVISMIFLVYRVRSKK